MLGNNNGTPEPVVLSIGPRRYGTRRYGTTLGAALLERGTASRLADSEGRLYA